MVSIMSAESRALRAQSIVIIVYLDKDSAVYTGGSYRGAMMHVNVKTSEVESTCGTAPPSKSPTVG